MPRASAASRTAGLGTDAIRSIPVDADMRMNVSALRQQIDHNRAARDVP
jgi:glutamate/tyrosine decarboxylase-like PLP-dependent enzyme